MNMKTMQILDKWKYFSMSTFLSDWDGDAVEIFDKLSNANDDEIEALFEEFQIDIWQPFEYWMPIDVFEKILDLATNAQMTENEGKQ